MWHTPSALLLAVGIGALALACDSKPTETPPATRAESATPSSAESTQQPVTATPAASATPGTPVFYRHPRLDELFVYTVATGEDKANERLHVRRSVVVQDLRA